MEKLCSVFIAFFIAIVIGTTAFAADYHNEEADFYLDLPEDCFVLYPEMTEEYFAQYSDIFAKSYDEFMDYFAENRFACEIYNYDDESEISVLFFDYDYPDYSVETEDNLLTDLELFSDVLYENAEIISSEVYRNERTAFLKYSVIFNTNNVYGETYVTVNNGKMILIELYTYRETATPEQSARVKAVVDGVSFGKEQTSGEKEVQTLGQNVYYIEEYGLTVAIPEEYYSLTKEMSREEYAETGNPVSYEESMAYISDTNSALWAVSKKSEGLITVQIFNSQFDDYRNLSSDKLKQQLDNFLEAYGELGMVVEKGEIYTTDSYVFLKITGYDKKEDTFFICAMTVCGDKEMHIYLYPNLGKVTEEQEKTLDSIVESIAFDERDTENGTKEYHIDEVGFTVAIPDGNNVFTPDMTREEYESNFDYNWTYEEMMDYFRKYNCVLVADSKTGVEKIDISMEDTVLFDYNVITDELMAVELEEWVDYYTSTGISVVESEIYYHEQTKWVKLLIVFEDGDCALSYITVENGKIIHVDMFNYEPDVTEEQEKLLRAVVDGIVFDNISNPEEKEFKEFSSEYSGVSFNTQNNWYIKDRISDNGLEYIYMISGNGKATIIYNEALVADAMELDGGDYEYLKNINMTDIKRRELAEEMGVPEENVENVYYNGTKYFKVNFEDDDYRKEAILTLKDGMMYSFVFNAEDYGEEYEDFLSVIESVKYPEPVSDPEEEPVPEEKNSDGTMVAVVAIIAVVVIIIVAAKKKKADTAKSEAEQTEVPPVSEASVHNFCACCGAKLHEGSAFCHECGAPVKK